MSSKKHIIQTEMVPYQEDWYCGENGCTGKMQYTGTTFQTCPPQYKHACSKCDRTSDTLETYPRIVYKSK